MDYYINYGQRTSSEYSVEGKNKEHYKIKITIEKAIEEDEPMDYAKKITAKVTYPTGNKTKDVVISTLIENKNAALNK